MLECRFNKTTHHHPKSNPPPEMEWAACGAEGCGGGPGVRARGPGGQGWPHGVCVAAWRKLGRRARGHWALALDLDCACPRSVGGGRGAGQAAECVDRAGAGQLSGLCVAAGHGPALGLACMCMPRGVLVGLCAGCRRAKGVD